MTRDGTRITSENKENQDTWEYFINNVYNKTSQYNDTLGTPVYTLYLAWLEETYGQNKLERLWAWLDQAISQIVLGNYEENSTVTGTVGQVLMGLANLDLPGDIRDLSYDLIHWDTTKEHILQTVLDAAGLLPVIGAVKYGDEASSALKHADEVGEQTAKHGDINISLKPNVSNEKLKNIINDLYKGQNGDNIIGNGTTMDAVRYEIKTGQPTHGKFHTKKLYDYLNALQRRLRAGDLNDNDEAIVEALIEDIYKALNGQ